MNTADNIIIGKICREIRMDSGLTQLELAQRLGKPQSYVSKIERGERALDLGEAFVYTQAIGCPIGHLIEKLETLFPDYQKPSL